MLRPYEGRVLPLDQQCSKIWSDVRESDPRLNLGKVPRYHYANIALLQLKIVYRSLYVYR